MLLTSSMPDISKIVHDGLIQGLETGAIIFLKAAWPYILLFIAFGIIYGLVSRRKKKRF